ncbi:MAG: adenosylmethionine decarboxylase [Gammaproteobacteria bacterium]|nr:adenosylmethionine decarboxylase [Gammaproteobacteria bacterium]
MHIATPAAVELEVPTVKVGRWNDQNDVLAAQQNQLQNQPDDEAKDHFIERNGVEFAGTHLLLDLYGADHLDDIARIEQAMRDIVSACGATLLHIHLHHFSPSGGVSGVAVLSESHISVHTWPERDYAAFDVFMCGDAQPENAVPVLKRAFFPHRIEVCEELRGRVAK